MKSLQAAFEAYRKQIERLAEARLGGAKTRAVTEAASRSFREQLDRSVKSSKRLVMPGIILLFVLFGAGVAVIWHYLNSATGVGISLGVTFFSLLAVVEKLRRIWREKTLMEVTLTVL
ncbi:MAG: hypothetical protein ONB46_14720 [candidate division KSB1 bacterium]|nr:hypothetical protein [candidate division KSB1 bacterium]MDZ7367056.1 hypothetical protein [candidate division KSB1 bacterium]MDZ7406756.1 hypothetical protein [candidate division KSB1 bacterium]